MEQNFFGFFFPSQTSQSAKNKRDFKAVRVCFMWQLLIGYLIVMLSAFPMMMVKEESVGLADVKQIKIERKYF